MTRFVVLAVPLLVLVMAVFNFTAEHLGYATSENLPGRTLVSVWILESLGLAALFLLVQGRGGNRWFSGLASGWIAWVFRGPLLVITVAGILPNLRRDWWSISVGWLVLYTLCGLALALLDRPSSAIEEPEETAAP